MSPSNTNEVTLTIDRTDRRINYLSLTIYFIHILLNFLGTPLLKYFYLAEIIIFTFLSLKFEFKRILVPIIIFIFIEGQGRILWHYNPFSRVVFDFNLLLIIIKSAIEHRKIFNFSKIPAFITLAITGHFLWYIVQIFNLQSAGIIGVISASKIYIFPIILFFMFIQNPVFENEKKIVRIQSYISLIVFFQILLIFFQFYKGESILLEISQYYEVPLKGDAFSGISFRPFGTSFLPGSMSVYLAYSTGFLLLFNTKKQIYNLLRIILVALAVIANLIMQVRSLLIKQLLILVGFNFTYFLKSERKFKLSLIIIPILISSIFAFKKLGLARNLFEGINLENTIDRIEDISSVENFTSKRASIGQVWDITIEKLSQSPLGLAPGRTGAARSIVKSNIINDPLFNEKFSWSYDNLIISLAIDLGIGMFFYLFIIILLPFLLIQKTIKAIRKKKKYPILAISAVTCAVILIGNWGAIGIPYNPESFFFWFWIATGLNEVALLEKELNSDLMFKNE